MIKNKIFAPLAGLLLLLVAGSLLAESGRTQIHANANLVQPVLPGMQAPGFSVKDVNGNTVSYDPARMEKPVILTFFRGGWCPYCNLHLAELRKSEQALKDMGFDIWFISIDRPEMLYSSLEDSDIGYTIYSDSGLDATRAFGLAFRVDDETVERYLGYDIDLEEASGEEHHVMPAPSTYLIGSDGIIRFQYTNPDYKVRLAPEVLMAAAEAYTADVDARLEREFKKYMESLTPQDQGKEEGNKH